MDEKKNPVFGRKEQIEQKRQKLVAQQLQLKERKLPVLVLVEGWDSSGKGTLIGNLIKELDPRFYKVIPEKAPNEEEQRRPFLWKYMENIPEAGKITFMDAGWMQQTVNEVIGEKISGQELKRRYEEVNIFERQLRDNGYLLLKLFLDISKSEQKKRMGKLLDSKNTTWRVTDADKEQLKNHKEYDKAYNAFMEETNTEDAPWYRIDALDEKEALLDVFTIFTGELERAIGEKNREAEIQEGKFKTIPMEKLSEVDLSQEMTKAQYNKELEKCQKRLKELHNKLYRKKIPVVIAYEGWDAAGKGGNIKRLTSALDARGYEVHPIASPEPHEKSRHYLWRFWHRLPKTGHIAIFDRTWYGRVMVERLEGFCSENDWKRAYHEINEFEKQLSDWGAIVLKFWIHIDKDTQLARFNERQNTPEKQWKITDEDWRNREKWEQYEEAVDEMLQKTSTKQAPWHIIESNNKYYARIKVLHLVIDAIEEKTR